MTSFAPTPALAMPIAEPSAHELVVIDVRSSAEFAGGHVSGAIHVPLDRLAADIEQVAPNKNAPLMLYCASGARSGMACNFLQQMGYRDIVNGCSAGAVAQKLNRPIHRA